MSLNPKRTDAHSSGKSLERSLMTEPQMIDRHGRSLMWRGEFVTALTREELLEVVDHLSKRLEKLDTPAARDARAWERVQALKVARHG